MLSLIGFGVLAFSAVVLVLGLLLVGVFLALASLGSQHTTPTPAPAPVPAPAPADLTRYRYTSYGDRLMTHDKNGNPTPHAERQDWEYGM